MTVLGFLHTSPVHVPTFDALVRVSCAAARVCHVVDEQLLALARLRAPEAVTGAVRDRLNELTGLGADVICCTCSTIGHIAEAEADSVPVPVLRVDRPMARRAVELGPRVGVVAALDSTLEPPRALILEEAGRVGAEVSLMLVTATGAWGCFEAGDYDAYLGSIASQARRIASSVDVIVLAQASMAAAERYLTALDTPVVSSPRLAVEHLKMLTR